MASHVLLVFLHRRVDVHAWLEKMEDEGPVERGAYCMEVCQRQPLAGMAPPTTCSTKKVCVPRVPCTMSTMSSPFLPKVRLADASVINRIPFHAHTFYQSSTNFGIKSIPHVFFKTAMSLPFVRQDRSVRAAPAMVTTEGSPAPTSAAKDGPDR